MPNRFKKTVRHILMAIFSALLVLIPVSGVYARQPLTVKPETKTSPENSQAPLEQLKDAVLSFFAPMHGDVISVKDGVVTAAISNSASVKEGMRFRILKKGAEFFHPVTGQPLWTMEEPVGAAQTVKILPEKTGVQAELKIIQGKAGPGDIVRISGTRVRLLFYQLKKVSWGLSDQYYDMLKKTGRFELLSSSLDGEQNALAEGKRLKADAVLIISQEIEDGRTVLNQKLVWTSDSSQAMVSGTVFDKKDFNDLTLGDKLFAPKNDTLITFNVPFGARMICLADMAGKGNQVLAIASESDISFYNISSSLLAPALGGAEIKGGRSEQFLRMQAADINGDGRDAIIVAAKKGPDLLSSIYVFREGSFHKIYQGRFFLRWMNGGLYAQKAGLDHGFEGGVYSVKWEKDQIVWGGKVDLPSGVNIFDFSFMHYGGKTFTIAYDDQGFIKVYGKAGLVLWKSPGSFGGFPMSFKKDSASPALEDSHWYIKDPIEVIGRDALIINRTYLIKMVQGLGYKSSRIAVLRWNGASMQQLVLGGKVGGTIINFTASKNRLMMLMTPVFGLTFSKILQGESPFTTRLYMYPLEGE